MSEVGINPQYPQAGSGVFSLRRLNLSIAAEALPLRVQVGGRLVAHGGEWFIEGDGLKLRLPEWPSVKSGDLVVVTLQKQDLSIRAGELIVNKIENLEVSVRSSAPFLGRAFSPEVAERWSDFVFEMRRYFRGLGLIEVATPTLVSNPGMEPELEPFQTTWQKAAAKKTLFLHTSPELHLKQLMVQGFSDIFEIKPVFRNEEHTPVHEPEFFMLEWYRAFANLSLIEQDLRGLLSHLYEKGLARAFGDIHRLSVTELFKRAVGFELQPHTTREELLALAETLKLSPDSKWTWNDLFHLVWVAKVEETIPHEPTIVYDYPPSQAALSRLNLRGWADRFELYWDQVEIANAFHELNDPHEQRARFERDQKLREKYGRTPLAIDENFMRALEYGLPPSGGIALGVDRLFMVASGMKRLSDTRAFPAEHQK